MNARKTPIKAKKTRKRTPKPGKLRPAKGTDRKVKHGVWSLDRLLKADLDGRLAIAKRRAQLEAQWVDHCGGLDSLNPALLSLIKRITHKELISQHSEKMALLGRFELGDKHYLALSNSLRLDILALEKLIGGNRSKKLTLEDYIEAQTSKGERPS